MIKYSSPGIYIEEASKRIEPMKLRISGLTGFIGIAEKGPLHKGIRLKNFQDFLNIYGSFVSYGNLAYAVFGFFNAGGNECIVVRTAHQSRQDDEESRMNSTAPAVLKLESLLETGKELIMTARSPGGWGNRVNVKLWYTPLFSRPLSGKVGKTWIELESCAEFLPGDYVRIQGESLIEYHQVQNVTKNRLTFAFPLKSNCKPAEVQIYCEKLRVSVLVNYRKIIEEYLHLSLNPGDENYFIEHINARSGLVEISSPEPGLHREVYYEHLQGGKNGVMGITPADFIGYYKGFGNNRGLGIFEAFEDISLLAAPDLAVFQDIVYKDREQALSDIFTVQKAMVEQCEKMGSRFAILDAPDIEDVLEVVTYAQKFDTAHAALYYPKIHILNPQDISGLTTICIPPSGHIAGEFVKSDLLEGIYHAPANKRLQGAVGMKHRIEHGLYDVMYGNGINGLKYFPGRGVKIWGARTLSSDKDWRYINVRRAFCAIREALKQGSGWAIFEPNDLRLRKHLVRHIVAFLLNLWSEGYMQGTVPEEGFYVRCDEELNPKENIDVGIITVEVGIAIARPAEFLVLKIIADREDSVISLDD